MEHINYPTYMPGGYQQGQQSFGPRPDGQQISQQMAVPLPQVQQVQPVVQQGQIFPQGFQGLSGASRPVTNREEAISIAADFSGSPMVFPDITHNRVYIKRWNFGTGAADFTEYAPVQPKPEGEAQDMVFASVQDLQNLQELVESLRTQGENLKAEIEKLRKPASVRPVKKDKGETGSE